jgi:hypothetical protein
MKVNRDIWGGYENGVDAWCVCHDSTRLGVSTYLGNLVHFFGDTFIVHGQRVGVGKVRE